MAACIIQKRDLEKLGNKLMIEFYNHVHNDYLLEEFDEVKLKRKYYDENLTKEFLSFYENKEKTIKNIYFDNMRYEGLVKMETKDLLSKIETEIKDKTLHFEIIYNFLDQMDIKLKIDKHIDHEIDEDLFYMKKAFIHMFEVYHYDYIYLDHSKYKIKISKGIDHKIDEDYIKNVFSNMKNSFSNMFEVFN